MSGFRKNLSIVGSMIKAHFSLTAYLKDFSVTKFSLAHDNVFFSVPYVCVTSGSVATSL